MVQPWNLGPPAADYTALGSIGETFNNAIDQSRKRALEEQKRNLLATAAQGGDLSKIGLGLIGSGDVTGGAALLQLGQKNGDREFDRNLFGGAPTSIGSIGKAPAASGVPVAGPASLIQNESGGNWQAQNNSVGAGGAAGHFGRLQFGQARLQEAQDAGAIPPGTTPQAFMASPELQKQAEAWHFNDIDQTIKQNGYDQLVGKAAIGGIPVTVDGLRAVAHLGGKEGLRKFVETGGRYNPADENGTRLSDYFARHGGAGAPTQVAQVPQGVPQPQGVQVAENEADVQRLEAQQAAQGQPPQIGAGGVYAGVPAEVLTGYLNNPKVPDSYKALMQQELASRQGGQAPVQVAQAAPQPGSTVADVPAQGAQPAQFVIPGATPQQAQSIASDPNVQKWSAIAAQARTEQGRAYAKTQFDLAVTDAKNRMEGAQETVEGKRLANEKLRREIAGDTTRSLITPEERKAAGVPDDYNGAVQIDRTGKLSFPGKATTEVNMTAEKAQDSTIGKAYGELFVESQKQGRDAYGQMNTIKTMQRLIDSPDFYSGSGGDRATAFKRAAVSLGIKDAESAAPNELFQKLSKQLVLDKAGGSFGTGFSNGDRDYIDATTANLQNTPDGNKAILAMAQKVAERSIIIAKLARDFAKENKGRLGPEFDDKLAQFAEENPLFNPDSLPGRQKAAAPVAVQPQQVAPPRQAAPQATGSAQPPTATNPRTGERLMLNANGQWVPYS